MYCKNKEGSHNNNNSLHKGCFLLCHLPCTWPWEEGWYSGIGTASSAQLKQLDLLTSDYCPRPAAFFPPPKKYVNENKMEFNCTSSFSNRHRWSSGPRYLPNAVTNLVKTLENVCQAFSSTFRSFNHFKTRPLTLFRQVRLGNLIRYLTMLTPPSHSLQLIGIEFLLLGKIAKRRNGAAL